MRRIAWLVLAIAPVTVLALTPAAGASIHSLAGGSSRADRAQTLPEGLVIGRPAIIQTTASVRQAPMLKKVPSPTWAGYTDDNSAGNKYDLVSGSWEQPAVTCPAAGNLAVAFWVGLDGFAKGSMTVEQDGTLALCVAGAASYYTWWEMYPNPPTFIGNGSTLAPGQKISASVVLSGGKYTLKLTVKAAPANNINTTQACPAGKVCGDSSAEWVAEAPLNAGAAMPMPEFKPWDLMAAAVKSGADLGDIATFPDDQVTMTNARGQVLALPGPLNGSDNGFTLVWKRSS
jgi:hypothetical protein